MKRRQLIQGAGGLMAFAALPVADRARSIAAFVPVEEDLTGRLARYMVAARDMALPPEVARAAKDRLLDTLAAMVSGAHLKPGELAIEFVRSQGGTPQATVVTAGLQTTAINAALANGMFAHADETDDFEPITKAHPGCAVVPAALAIGELQNRSGLELLRAVTLGYDVCCRFLLALGLQVRPMHRSAEGFSSTFGAAAAAAAMARLDETGTRYALSYAAQQVSGLWTWQRDEEHVEKAFDFSGMGARNGVTAALMVQSGFTGVTDVLDASGNALEALSPKPEPEQMVADLGKRFFVTETAIKPFSVGYPIQAPLDALLTLRHQHGLTPDRVARIVVRAPEDGARVVNDRAMPDVNLQYILAIGLIDGTVTFEDSHSYERMRSGPVQAVKARVELIADRSLMDPAAPRSGHVEVFLQDGRSVSHFTRFASGTKENPLPLEGVRAKARGLMEPVLGAARTESVIDQVEAIEELPTLGGLIDALR